MTTKLRVLDLNLWNINEPLEARMIGLVKALTELSPDIVCLQEVSPHPMTGVPQSEMLRAASQYPFGVYRKTGHWKGREEGLAILSKYPLLSVEQHFLSPAPEDMARQVVLAEIELDGHKVLVGNTHLAYRVDMTSVRRHQVEELLACIDKRCDDNKIATTVLCGDFNDTPTSSPVTAVLLNKHELANVFYGKEPTSDPFTFSSRNPLASAELGLDRWIDYIFTTKDLAVANRLVVFDTDDRYGYVSDHFGLFVELELT